MNTDGGILLPPTCKINYVNMQQKYVQAALAVKFSFFTHLEKLIYMKIKQYNHVFGSLFHLERIKNCSTFTHSPNFCKQIYVSRNLILQYKTITIKKKDG